MIPISQWESGDGDIWCLDVKHWSPRYKARLLRLGGLKIAHFHSTSDKVTKGSRTFKLSTLSLCPVLTVLGWLPPGRFVFVFVSCLHPLEKIRLVPVPAVSRKRIYSSNQRVCLSYLSFDSDFSIWNREEMNIFTHGLSCLGLIPRTLDVSSQSLLWYPHNSKLVCQPVFFGLWVLKSLAFMELWVRKGFGIPPVESRMTVFCVHTFQPNKCKIWFTRWWWNVTVFGGSRLIQIWISKSCRNWLPISEMLYCLLVLNIG